LLFIICSGRAAAKAFGGGQEFDSPRGIFFVRPSTLRVGNFLVNNMIGSYV
jgi:hypothetical protein